MRYRWCSRYVDVFKFTLCKHCLCAGFVTLTRIITVDSVIYYSCYLPKCPLNDKSTNLVPVHWPAYAWCGHVDLQQLLFLWRSSSVVILLSREWLWILTEKRIRLNTKTLVIPANLCLTMKSVAEFDRIWPKQVTQTSEWIPVISLNTLLFYSFILQHVILITTLAWMYITSFKS